MLEKEGLYIGEGRESDKEVAFGGYLRLMLIRRCESEERREGGRKVKVEGKKVGKERKT